MRVRPSLASLTVLLNLLSAAAQAGDLKPREQVEVTLDARVGELHVTHHLPIAEILKAMPSPGADPQQALRTYIEANFYVHEPFGDAELAFVSAERRGDEMIVRYRGNLTPPSRALTVRDTLFSEVDPTAPIHVVVRERNSVQTFDLTAAQPSKSVGFDAVSDEAF